MRVQYAAHIVNSIRFYTCNGLSMLAEVSFYSFNFQNVMTNVKVPSNGKQTNSKYKFQLIIVCIDFIQEIAVHPHW